MTDSLPVLRATSVTAVAGITLIAGLVTYFVYKRSQNKPPTTWKLAGKVDKINIFPLKSGKKLAVQSAKCTKIGFRTIDSTLSLRDRSFLVYGEGNNEFKTARTYPKLLLIELKVHDENHVVIDAPGMRSLYVKLPSENDDSQLKITLHSKEEIFSLDCGDEAAKWVSQYITDNASTTGFRLGYHNAEVKNYRDLNKTHKQYTKVYKDLGSFKTGLYSDLTAVHMINLSSVDELNSRIEGEKIAAENFRPNVIIADATPWEEDNWKWIKIGDLILRNLKPTTRCTMTTINNETGERSKSREPLKTLESYRKMKDIKGHKLEAESTIMGINLGVHQEGSVNVGDNVYVG